MHKVLFASLLLICCAVARRSSYVRPPRVSDTIDGQPRVKILPQPTNVELGSSPMVGLIPNYKSKFSFNIQHAYTDVEKDMLTKAFKRYNEIIFYDQTIREQGERVCDSKVITCIYAVNVFIKSTASKIDLQLGEDESYSLQTTKNSIDITSPTIWGALHALETVSQMIVLSDPHGSPAYAIQTEMNLPITITDSPRFPWRGLLIDTARHYISKQKIKHIIDSMTYIKLNTFHWHVVDDQSFPIEIPSLPELSNKGRYSPLAVYTPDDIKEIVQYAFERGVRIVFEFDVPGHSSSWGRGYPNISSHCPGLGVMNPAREDAYDAIDKVLEYVSSVNPEKYFMVGGDEIDLNCWKNDPTVVKFMEDKGYKTMDEVLAYFETRVIALVAKHGLSVNCWQELLLNYNRTVLNLPKTTVVTAWTGPDRLKPIVQAGYPALLNGGWYLDYESQPWSAYYSNEPFAGNLTDAEKKLVIGGEASMWAERVDDIVFDERVFPRSFGTAERLWSSQNVNIVDDITEDRMDQHRCNFVRRGVGAGPIRPSYCEAVYVPYKYSWQK